MLLMLCLATTKKLGHQVSLSLECKGLHSKMEYRKKPIFPKYTVKIVQLPQHIDGQDVGSLFLDPTKFGNAFDSNLAEWYANIFDMTFNPACTDPNPAYESFKNTVKILFDLVHDKKHDKTGNNSAAYKHYQKDALLAELESKAMYDHSILHGGPAFGRLVFGEKVTFTKCPEGLTLRSRVFDEAVFEGADAIKIVVGPRQTSWENFEMAKSVDDLNLSADFLSRAGIVAQGTGNRKDLELIVVCAPGITEAAIRKKVDAIMQSASYEADVYSTAPKELNVATMGGVGMSAAYHYHTRNFILTLRSGFDHIWGKFRQNMMVGANSEINPSLGFGGYVGIGGDYKWSENAAVGVEVGMRLNQLKTPLIADLTKKLSTWFSSPYAQLNCTFFSEESSSLGFFSGYVFAKEFTIKATGTQIPYGSSCEIGGLYAGVRLSKYF